MSFSSIEDFVAKSTHNLFPFSRIFSTSISSLGLIACSLNFSSSWQFLSEMRHVNLLFILLMMTRAIPHLLSNLRARKHISRTAMVFNVMLNRETNHKIAGTTYSTIVYSLYTMIGSPSRFPLDENCPILSSSKMHQRARNITVKTLLSRKDLKYKKHK